MVLEIAIGIMLGYTLYDILSSVSKGVEKAFLKRIAKNSKTYREYIHYNQESTPGWLKEYIWHLEHPKAKETEETDEIENRIGFKM